MTEISKEGTKRQFTAKRSSALKVVFSTTAETLKADWFCVYCRLLWSVYTCCWVVPFSPGRDFCLAGSVTFGSSLCRSEKASRSVSVTTNDYQWIWASRQNCQQLQGPGGGGGRVLWGDRGLHPQVTHTHTQATKPHTNDVPGDWIHLLWEAGSDAVCLEADWYSSRRSQRSLRGGHPIRTKPSFHLSRPSFVFPRSKPRQNFALRENRWQ